MGSLHALIFLEKVAMQYRHDKETFSKTEILHKLNRIKYLARKKDIPKLSLEKEIVHLEQKVQGIFELEKRILRERKKESRRIGIMKRQLTLLRKQLGATKSGDLQKKVDTLSHLIGDYLARHDSKKQVGHSQVLSKAAPTQGQVQDIKPLPIHHKNRAQVLMHRITLLKQEIEIKKHMGLATAEIESHMKQIQAALQKFMKEHPVTQKDLESKHLVLFHTPPPTKHIVDHKHELDFKAMQVEKKEVASSKLPLK